MAKPTSQSSSEKSGGSHESQSHAKMPPSRDNVFKSRRLEENARKDLISGEAKIGNEFMPYPTGVHVAQEITYVKEIEDKKTYKAVLLRKKNNSTESKEKEKCRIKAKSDGREKRI